MHDLKKVEEKFHEYLKARLDENTYHIDEIKITEELLEKEEAFYISFGWISYFLVIEDEKPVIYANACSRMDLDVVAFIDDNYQSDFSLDELSALANISPQYLCRLFKDCYHMRPFEYLAKKRLQRAKMMLTGEKYSVNEIAQLVGYNDCSYFCSVFKKREGLSPAEFRALNCSQEKSSDS